ncbi:MAG: DUF222 domain-containing protein, partial [Jatrophihabitantaceae bacterium]
MDAPVIDPVASLSDAQIMQRLRDNERRRRELDVEDHALLAQVETRGVPHAHGCKNPVDFLRYLLTISAGEAAARLAAAHALGPRRSLTGESLGPIYPTVAAALAAGQICSRAAATIVAAVERLPAAVQAGVDRIVEATLTDFAKTHDPRQLATHAADLRNRLDQDGALHDAQQRERAREIRLRVRPDGSGYVSGEVSSQWVELFRTTTGALGAPRPHEDGTADPRSPAQRRHDAILEAMQRLFAAGQMPDAGGCRTTVVLTMDVQDFATNTGSARTGYGTPIPVPVAKTWLEPEARAILVLLSKTNGIEAYSSTQRLFTEQQRLAMIARDRGCSYWGCDMLAAWTQAHHVHDYRHTRTTRVDDGTLVCGG